MHRSYRPSRARVSTPGRRLVCERARDHTNGRGASGENRTRVARFAGAGLAAWRPTQTWIGPESNRPQPHCKCSSPPWHMPTRARTRSRRGSNSPIAVDSRASSPEDFETKRAPRRDRTSIGRLSSDCTTVVLAERSEPGKRTLEGTAISTESEPAVGIEPTPAVYGTATRPSCCTGRNRADGGIRTRLSFIGNEAPHLATSSANAAASAGLALRRVFDCQLPCLNRVAVVSL